jgi:hypothetical protein
VLGLCSDVLEAIPAHSYCWSAESSFFDWRYLYSPETFDESSVVVEDDRAIVILSRTMVLV